MIKKKEASKEVVKTSKFDEDFDEVILEEGKEEEIDIIFGEEVNSSKFDDQVLDLEIIEIQSVQDGIYPAVIKGTSRTSKGKVKITFLIPTSDEDEEEVYLYVDTTCKRGDILFRLKRCISKDLKNFSELIDNEVWVSIKNNDDGTNVYVNVVDVFDIDVDNPTINEKGYFKR